MALYADLVWCLRTTTYPAFWVTSFTFHCQVVWNVRLRAGFNAFTSEQKLLSWTRFACLCSHFTCQARRWTALACLLNSNLSLRTALQAGSTAQKKSLVFLAAAFAATIFRSSTVQTRLFTRNAFVILILIEKRCALAHTYAALQKRESACWIATSAGHLIWTRLAVIAARATNASTVRILS